MMSQVRVDILQYYMLCGQMTILGSEYPFGLDVRYDRDMTAI